MINLAPPQPKTTLQTALSYGDACRGNAVAFLKTLSGKEPSGSPQQEPVKKVSLKGAVLDMSEGAQPPEEQIYNQLRNKLMETYPGGVPDGEKLRIMLYELNKKGVGLDLSNSPEGKKAAIAVIGSWMKDGNITVDSYGKVSLKEGSSVESQMVSVDKFLKPEKKDETKQDLSDLKEKYDKQGEELKQANEQADKDKLEIQKGKEELVKEQIKHLADLKDEQDKAAAAEDQVKDLSSKLTDSQDKEKVATDEAKKARNELVEEANKHAQELTAEKDKTAAEEIKVEGLKKELVGSEAKEKAATEELVKLTGEHEQTKGTLGHALNEISVGKDANDALTIQLKDLKEKLATAEAALKEPDQAGETPPTQTP